VNFLASRALNLSLEGSDFYPKYLDSDIRGFHLLKELIHAWKLVDGRNLSFSSCRATLDLDIPTDHLTISILFS
jgi:hypothetical protein